MKYQYSFTIYFLTIIIAVTAVSCKKEAALNHEPLPEKYVMVQGTGAADQYRYDFFNKYGTKILFAFDKVEYFYSPTNTIDQYDEIRYITNGALHERALRFINTHWLSFYPEAFKQKYLPRYIFVVDRLVDLIEERIANADSVKYAKSNAFSYVLGAGLGNRFDTMSVETKKRLRSELHYHFLYSFLYAGLKLGLPDDFFEPTKTAYLSARPTPLANDKSDYGPAGFLIPPGTAKPAAFPSRIEDIQLFLKFIIESDQATVDAYINPTAHSKVKQKYNVLVNYYNTLGINIRAIHQLNPELPGTLTGF